MTSVPRLSWAITRALRPGYDYVDDVVYMTLPVQERVEKTVGKGKAATTVLKWEPAVGCVTSEPAQFAFNEETVTALGYAFPASGALITKDRRWSEDSILAFLDKQTEPPDVFMLFQRLREIYVKYIEFSDDRYYDLMALFVLNTYVFRLFKTSGYIHFNGTAASGKSQNLRILTALAFNAIWASNMSSPALFRTMAGNPGTMCIDEAEDFSSERGQELRSILNAGYTDGSTVGRTEAIGDGAFRVIWYDSYGPKVLASINPLDDVLGSRSLIVTMMPAVRTIPEFDQHSKAWQPIRDQLYLFAMHHSAPLAEHIADWNTIRRFDEAPKLRSRQWEVSQSYIVLADYIDESGQLTKDIIDWFNDYYAESQRSQDSTDRMRLLLKTLPRLLREKQPWEGHWYSIKDIHELMKELLEEDQTEFYKTRTVSKNLTSLGFKRRRSLRNVGTQVWLEEQDIRTCIERRRVEPFVEDEAWLRGEVSYLSDVPAIIPTQGHLPSPEESDQLWSQLGDSLG
jgi:hypothetical protein